MAEPMSLRGKLEALASESCVGSEEYRACAPTCSDFSDQANAMAKALLTMMDTGFLKTIEAMAQLEKDLRTVGWRQ